MFLFGNKNKEISDEQNIINKFNEDKNSFLEKDEYISRKGYLDVIEQYRKFYEQIDLLLTSGVLNSYCKKKRLNVNNVLNFHHDFHHFKDIIDAHNKKFIERHLVQDKEYLNKILQNVDKNILLDDDQRKVVLTDEDYCLVIAGAGAGKTTTVAAKVKYLVEKKKIDPNQILIISFTNKAVGELKEKVNRDLKIPCPITTFHSAGNAILRKQSEEKLNIVEGSFLYNTILDYFQNKMKDRKTAENIVMFFGSYFDRQYETEDKIKYLNSIVKSDFSTLKSNLNEYKQILTVKATGQKITLNNEIVNSAQEVQIANFLYLNDIEYEYEPIYPYNIFMSRKRYTPDFLIKHSGQKIYLEHFGISEDGRNDLYSEQELIKYKNAIKDKIEIHKNHNTKLIYTYSRYNDGQELLVHLHQLLKENNIEMNPKPPEVVLEKLVNIQENKYISKMVCLICDFINNFKVNGYTEDKFYEFIRTTKSVRTQLFLEICRECYLEYQRALSRNNAVDFQDMINDAARALREVKSLKQKLDFKYIIVDEYQDISRQRFDMAKELSEVTDAKIIAVGDDWQSIFAFSGSDITLFTQFCEKMGYGEELKITKTYRNAQEVIDIAGGFVQKNDFQIKKNLISPKHIDEPVVIVSYDDSPRRKEENVNDGGPLYRMAKALEYAIDDIVLKFGKNSKILLIGRYGYDGTQLARTKLFDYIEYGNKVVCKKYPNVKMDFLTAHSSKGLGYDNVIIINAKNAVYGFPSKIEDDPVMKLVIKQNNEIEYAEERRLFYVALTRTKNKVYLIAPEQHPSQFVTEIKNEYKNVVVKGSLNPEPLNLITNKICPICGYPLQLKYKKGCNGLKLWVCTNESEVCGFLSNNLAGGKMSIQKCPDCVDGYLIVKTKNEIPFLACTNYKPDGTGCNRTMSQKEYENNLQINEIFEIQNTRNNSCDDVSEEEIDVDLEKEKETVYFKDKFLNDLAIDLRKFAQAEALKSNVQFWKILRRKAIIDICNKLPIDKEEFYTKNVILGKQKVENYGDMIAKIVKDHIATKTNVEKPTNKSIASTILNTYKDISYRKYYGVTILVSVLKGNKPKAIIEDRLNETKYYGIYSHLQTSQIFDLVNKMIEYNIFYKTSGLYPTLRINNNINVDDVDNKLENELAEISEECNNKNVSKAMWLGKYNTIEYKNFSVFIDENGEIVTDLNLLFELQAIRRDLAIKRDVPSYVICHNDVLVKLATYKPILKEDFLKIKGIKERSYEKFGDIFIEIIKKYK